MNTHSMMYIPSSPQQELITLVVVHEPYFVQCMRNSCSVVTSQPSYMAYVSRMCAHAFPLYVHMYNLHVKSQEKIMVSLRHIQDDHTYLHLTWGCFRNCSNISLNLLHLHKKTSKCYCSRHYFRLNVSR